MMINSKFDHLNTLEFDIPQHLRENLNGVRSINTRHFGDKEKGTCHWCKQLVVKPNRNWCTGPDGECHQKFLRLVMYDYFIYKRDKVCQKCGGHGSEIDHISPICEGGTSLPDNLRLLCTNCHREETNKLLRKRMLARKERMKGKDYS